MHKKLVVLGAVQFSFSNLGQRQGKKHRNTFVCRGFLTQYLSTNCKAKPILFNSCLAKAFKEDINIPTNAFLNIKIESDNFGAVTTMDIDIKSFQKFAGELFNVYTSLQGCAELKETYGNNYIMFKAKSNGHIYVNGIVNSLFRNGYEQELKFENDFDQTYLKEFVNEINR